MKRLYKYFFWFLSFCISFTFGQLSDCNNCVSTVNTILGGCQHIDTMFCVCIQRGLPNCCSNAWDENCAATAIESCNCKRPTALPTQITTLIPIPVPTLVPTITPTLPPTMIPTSSPTFKDCGNCYIANNNGLLGGCSDVFTMECVCLTALGGLFGNCCSVTWGDVCVILSKTYCDCSAPATLNPTILPTNTPTNIATQEWLGLTIPTNPPTNQPTGMPTYQPTEIATSQPTDAPSELPTENPTENPTERPTERPTEHPTECSVCSQSSCTTLSLTTSNGICATSQVKPTCIFGVCGSHCSGLLPFASASNQCARLGMRLCTSIELIASLEVVEFDCDYDGYFWTISSCSQTQHDIYYLSSSLSYGYSACGYDEDGHYLRCCADQQRSYCC